MMGVFIGIQVFVGSFSLRQVLWSQWKTLVSALGMGLGSFLLYYGLYMRVYGDFYKVGWDWGLCGVLLAGMGLYCGLAHLFKSQEYMEVREWIETRWRRQRGQRNSS